MAISNLNLNVRANTSRALADFNKFSRSLDNKFLVSGLKLDVIRSALNTINRDFQRAIGEQGLASAGSLRAAQNQAALLTQTFKGFASESALAITTQIGTALNRVAVTAGGTMKDVQRTLAATPFISTNLSEDLREQLSIGIMSAQRDMRRAGLGDNFGGIAQQFLMGRATGLQLVETGGAIESFLGAEIIKRAGGEGRIYSPEMRSEILAEILNDPDIQDQLKLMARRAAGFRIVLEDLNTQLFNTESGVFGALRKVIDRTGKSTTMFDEVNKLVESIFGADGMFRSIFKSIEEVFGIGDPMRPLITAVQFIKGMVDEFTKFFSGPVFKDILQFSKEALSRVGDLFREIYETIRGADFSPDSIRDAIGQIGLSLREYIREFGEYIRGQDISDESGVVGGIAGTLLEEIGKTAVTVIKELLSTILNKVPEIATQVLPELNKGINAVLTEAFGEIGGKIAKIVLSFVPGPVGAVARASTAGDLTGGGGNVLSMLAMGGAALMGTGAGAKLFGAARGVGRFGYGAARVGRGLFGPDEQRMNLLNSLTNRTNRIEEIYNRRMRGLGLSGAQRTPLSGLLGRNLSPRSQFASTLPENYYPPGTPRYPYSDVLGGPNKLRSDVLAGPYSLKSPIPSGPYSELGKITAQSTMFSPVSGFTFTEYMRGERRRRSENISRLRELNVQESMSRYRESIVSPYGPSTSTFRTYDIPEYLTSDPRPYSGYSSPIGPQPHGYEWAASREYGNQEGYAPFMPSEYVSPREREVRRRMAVSERYKRMYESGSLRRMKRRNMLSGITRPGRMGMLGLGAAGIVTAATFLGGPGANAAEIDPETGMPKPTAAESVGGVLSGGFEGAMLGASIGSIIPGIGTAAGAVIGGVIGGVAPLMDEGIRESIGEFISNLGTTFTSSWTGFTKWIGESMSWAGEKLEEVFKLAVNGIINALNIAISAFTALPRSLIGSIEGFIKNIPLPNKEGVLGTLGSLKSFYSMQIPNFNEGKDYFGPAMAKEAMMGGRKPMVVNDGEFVIPRDGFPILAGLVGQNLRSTGVINQGESKPVMINISLSVTANSVVANAEELADTLRDPVYQIINDAWIEAYNSDKVLRTRL